MRFFPFRHGLLMAALLALSAKDAARANITPAAAPAARPVSASPAVAAPQPRSISSAKVRDARPARRVSRPAPRRKIPRFVPRPLQSMFNGNAVEKGDIEWKAPTVLTGCVVGQPCACSLSTGACVSGPSASR